MRQKSLAARSIAVVGLATLALTACTGPSGGGTASSSGSSALTVGTTDKVTSLDPAGSYDNGSTMLQKQVFAYLLSAKPGSSEVVPDAAESASFTKPTQYTVKLKSGLKFANGHVLDSKDVKFSFDRIKKINDPNGPASLLGNLVSVETPDATTVVFNLKAPNDQTFPQILSTSAAPIVDDEVFPADKVLPDADVVKAKAFAGPYTIDSYNLNTLVSFKANPEYKGMLGKAKTDTVNLKYYSDSNNLKLDVQQGNIDVAWRSLTATDVESLGSDSKLTVHKGPGGEIRYIVFNFDTQPFGAKAEGADPKKALAVRQAVANLVDREALSKDVYKGTYTPLYSYVPDGFTGATTPFKEMYGDGSGKPSADKAKKALTDAGITTPVTLQLQYNPDHYGKSSGDEYAKIKSQLEGSGLFKVDLKSTEWVTYAKERTKDAYPAYQLGWFPDYSDADNYLTPFFTKDNFVANHYDNATVQRLIGEQAVNPDKAARTKQIGEIQTEVAKDISTLPLLQGSQVAVSGKDVKGVDETLDPSFTFRLALLSK